MADHDLEITGRLPGEENEEVHVTMAPGARPATEPDENAAPTPSHPAPGFPVGALPENELVGGPVLSEDWGRFQAPEPAGRAVEEGSDLDSGDE